MPLSQLQSLSSLYPLPSLRTTLLNFSKDTKMSAIGGVRGAVGGGQQEDKKPVLRPAYIELKIQSQGKEDVLFKFNRSSQLRKLMTAYCNRQSMVMNSVVFLFDGKKIPRDQTPEELGMEDGDEIDVMLPQNGGGDRSA